VCGAIIDAGILVPEFRWQQFARLDNLSYYSRYFTIDEIISDYLLVTTLSPNNIVI